MNHEAAILEKGLLGMIVAEGNEGMAMASTHGITAAHFSIPEISRLYSAVEEQYNKGDPIDELAMSRILPHSDMLLLFDCVRVEGTIHLIPRYIKTLKDLHKKREIKKLGQRMVESADESLVSAEDLLSYSETKLLDIASGSSTDSIRSLKESLKLTAGALIDRILGKIQPFIATGFKKIDDLIAGFRAKRLYIFAARPGMGKTALGWRFARNIAMLSKKHVYFLSLEMSHDELSERLISSEIRFNLRQIEMGMMGDMNKKQAVIEKIERKVKEIEDMTITIDDHHDLTITQIRSRVRHMVAQKKCDIVIIDYLQLIHVEDGGKRREQIGAISRGLKNMAKELNIPVVALCQLNREPEKEKRMPRLSDLRESGDIEQDADVVGMLYRADDWPENEVGLSFPKNRGGKPDTFCKIIFEGAYTLFSDESYRDPEHQRQQEF